VEKLVENKIVCVFPNFKNETGAGDVIYLKPSTMTRKRSISFKIADGSTRSNINLRITVSGRRERFSALLIISGSNLDENCRKLTLVYQLPHKIIYDK